MLTYIANNYGKILQSFLGHLELVLLTLLLSIPIAILISFVIGKNKYLNRVVLFAILLIYCIPSIALFTLLITILGLGKLNAIVAMTAFNQILLVRNITVARESLSADLIEVAKGMDMSATDRFIRVEFPLMKPHLIAGLRIATISTTGIASMASLINAGGLGVILFEGMRQNHIPKLIVGILLISGLAFALNSIFSKLEYTALMKANGYNPNVFWNKR